MPWAFILLGGCARADVAALGGLWSHQLPLADPAQPTGLECVDWKVINKEHHVIPQRRKCVYIIGGRKDIYQKRTP
jgi:hypothetical protein